MSTAVGGSTGSGAESDEVAAPALKSHQPLTPLAASKTNGQLNSKGIGKGAAKTKSKGNSSTTVTPLTLSAGSKALTSSDQAVDGWDPLTDKITSLRNQQIQQRKERHDIAKSLRNDEKRKRRLKKRAKQLTDEDLMQVMMLRKGNAKRARCSEGKALSDDEDKLPALGEDPEGAEQGGADAAAGVDHLGDHSTTDGEN